MNNFKYLINEIDCMKYYFKRIPNKIVPNKIVPDKIILNKIKIIESYLEELKKSDKNSTLFILETLIDKFFFRIFEDNLMNDIRNIQLIDNSNYKINILSTFIIHEYTSNMKESIEILFNNNLYKL